MKSKLAQLFSLLLITGTAHAQLVGHWVADDWSGSGSWIDRVSAIPATIGDNPTLSPTLFVTPGSLRGIAFDGNDSFNVTPLNTPVVGASKMTVFAMFRTSTAGRVNNVGTNWWNNSGIVGAEAAGNHNDWGLMLLQDGRPQGGFRTKSVERGDVVDSRIHTTAITWDGATGDLDFYLDGALQGSVTESSGVIANFGFAIGQFRDNGFVATGGTRVNFFTGEIAVVQLYTSIEDVELLHASIAGCVASAPNYGTGLPGNFGVPTLTASAAPAFNTNTNISASNSSGTVNPGLVLVGLRRASVPFLGGTLLVDPVLQTYLAVPAGGLVIPFPVPDLSASCGTTPTGLAFYLQVLQLDSAAAGGVSMTPGLRLLLGL